MNNLKKIKLTKFTDCQYFLQGFEQQPDRCLAEQLLLSPHSAVHAVSYLWCRIKCMAVPKCIEIQLIVWAYFGQTAYFLLLTIYLHSLTRLFCCSIVSFNKLQCMQRDALAGLSKLRILWVHCSLQFILYECILYECLCFVLIALYDNTINT